MATKNMTLRAKARLIRPAVDDTLLSPLKGRIVKPVTARMKNGFADSSKPNPAVVIAANRCDRSMPGDLTDKFVQGRKPGTPVHKVAPEQDDVGPFPGNDFEQALDNLGRAALFQMKIAGKKDSSAQAEMPEFLVAHGKRPSRSDLQRL